MAGHVNTFRAETGEELTVGLPVLAFGWPAKVVHLEDPDLDMPGYVKVEWTVSDAAHNLIAGDTDLVGVRARPWSDDLWADHGELVVMPV